MWDLGHEGSAELAADPFPAQAGCLAALLRCPAALLRCLGSLARLPGLAAWPGCLSWWTDYELFGA